MKSAPTTSFWWASGAVLALLQVVLTVVSFRFAYTEPLESRPLLLVVLVFLAAGAVYGVAGLRALRCAPPLRLVLVVSVLLRLPLLFSHPIQEDDIYRYIWDGRVSASGLDPYAFSSSEIERYEDGDGDFQVGAVEALTHLVALKRRSVALETIFSRINNRDYATVYPPITQLIFAVHGGVVPVTWSPYAQVTSMKALLGVFDLLVLASTILLLRLAGRPVGLSLLYGWCPLVLKELSNSGHMDAIPTVLVVLALCALVSRRSAFYGACLGLAVLAKVYAVLLLPLGLRVLGVRRAVTAASVFLAILVIGALLLPSGDGRRETTLIAFLLHWQNHDAVFTWLLGAWRLGLGGGEVSVDLLGASFSVESAYIATLVSALTALMALELALVWRLDTRSTGDSVVRSAFCVLTVFFLLSPVGFPWYFIWSVPLLPFARSRAWLCLPTLLMLYYLRFWFDYQHSEGYGGFSRAVDFFDYVVVSLEFGFFFFLLLVEARQRRRRTASGT